MTESDCPLCSRVDHGSRDSDFLASTESVVLYRGPFWDRWPGSVLVVAKKHCRDLHATRRVSVIQRELFLAEEVVRNRSLASHMNVVKFANAVTHLHWHLIPRFSSEIRPEKNPWELPGLEPSDLYGSIQDIPQVCLDDMRRDFHSAFGSPLPDFYSAAMIFRRRGSGTILGPSDKDVGALISAVRGNPEEWETLLMRRNYADFSWDHFGGRAECGEFPQETLVREFREETGWEVESSAEVGRVWTSGVPRGFVFVVIPSTEKLLEGSETPLPNPEVAEARYYSVSEIVESQCFPLKVRGRLKAFLEGRHDYSL